jgi:hypothetical protein
MPQIEARCRFVEQQQPRPMQRLAAGELDQHAGEMRTLLLAPGQRRQLPGTEMRQPDLVQRRPDQATRRRARALAGAHADDFLDREREGDVDVLRQHRAVLRQLARTVAVQVALFEPGRPAGWL